MVVNGDTVNIAVQGPDNSLMFYWTFNGSGTWHTETVGGALTAAQGPSLAVDGNTFYIAVVHSLWRALDVWYDTIGTGTWHPQELVGQDVLGLHARDHGRRQQHQHQSPSARMAASSSTGAA